MRFTKIVATIGPASKNPEVLEQMIRAGVEILHCKGVAFEWLRTVDDATRTLRTAEQRFGPPPLRL